MKKQIKLSLLSALLMLASCEKNPSNEGFREVTSSSSKYISKIVSYNPAPGQFINTSVGNTQGAASIVGGTDGLVSLGAFGGNIVFMFDHTVVNNSGDDFTILANAFDNSSELGIVRVSFDANGNGIADDVWYELYGSEHNSALTKRDYTITYSKPSNTTTASPISWLDSQGSTGMLLTTATSNNCYYPVFSTIEQTLSFTGTLLPNNSYQSVDKNGYRPVGKGYVDNFSTEYTMDMGNRFDISNARDESGNKVSLKGIDFIMVYTAIYNCFDNIGEASTEIRGAISLSVR